MASPQGEARHRAGQQLLRGGASPRRNGPLLRGPASVRSTEQPTGQMGDRDPESCTPWVRPMSLPSTCCLRIRPYTRGLMWLGMGLGLGLGLVNPIFQNH